DGAEVSAQVQGLVGGFLQLWLGASVYVGELSGNRLDLTIYGTTSATQGNCTYTVNSNLDARVDGDVITGQIRYEAKTVGNPDCAPLEGCATVQAFNGTRPPTQ